VRAGAEAAGLPPGRITDATTHQVLGDPLRTECGPGDLLLLKGSRGAALERVRAHLAAETAR
jgi:UDP-N-acetylmuramyl pentapeptide synthase